MFPGAKTTDDAWRSYNGRPATHAGRHVRLSVTGGQDMVLLQHALLRGDGYCEIKPPNAIQAYPTGELSRLQTISLSGGIRGESQVIDTLFMVSALRTFVGDNSLRLTSPPLIIKFQEWTAESFRVLRSG